MQREVRQVASSGEGRGRLGDATDGRARGDVPRRPRNGFGRRRCHYCEPCVTGRNREKRGRENDRWGPCVSSNFHLISNFWIVTPRPSHLPLPAPQPMAASNPLPAVGCSAEAACMEWGPGWSSLVLVPPLLLLDSRGTSPPHFSSQIQGLRAREAAPSIRRL